MLIKNSNIRRNLFHNRYIIIAIILAIILIPTILLNLNGKIREEQKKKSEQEDSMTNVEQNIYIPEQTMITGNNVPNEQQKKNENLIDLFFQYCNAKESKKAYDLLSNDCKEELYPTLERFEEQYINKIFATTRIYNMQSWIYSGIPTYQIRILEDILSTGNVNSNNVMQDYFTIVNENGTLLLNINSYIGKKDINKEKEVEGIKVLVKSVHVYKDYEIYYFNVTNSTNNEVLMDTGKLNKSIYETNNVGTKYSAYTFESNKLLLTVKENSEQEIQLKFNRIYNPTKWITSITFTDIIQNNKEYQGAINQEEYQRLKIEIEI